MKINPIALGITAALTSFAIPLSVARADTPEMRNPIATQAPATEADQLLTLRSREFGTAQPNVMQIPAAAFHPENTSGAVFSYKSYMYWGPSTGNTSGYAWAPLFLPTGASIRYMDLYYNDTNATEDLTVYLRKTSGENTAPIVPAYDTVVSASSTGSAGYGYAIGGGVFGISHTVNNNARYSADGGKYIFEAYFPADTGLSFSGVDIWWYRQISPAPVTNTFTDVPTSHWAFQHIEALKASGITSGATPTTFNPSGTVSRAEMAVFLARALGLHWDH